MFAIFAKKVSQIARILPSTRKYTTLRGNAFQISQNTVLKYTYRRIKPSNSLEQQNSDTNSTDFKVDDEGDNRIVYVTYQSVDSTDNSEETFVQIMDDLDRTDESNELKDVLLSDNDFKNDSGQTVSGIQYQVRTT